MVHGTVSDFPQNIHMGNTAASAPPAFPHPLFSPSMSLGHSVTGGTSVICICKFGAKFLIIVYHNNKTAITTGSCHVEDRPRSKQPDYRLQIKAIALQASP